MAAEKIMPKSGWFWIDNRAVDMATIGPRDWMLYSLLARLSGPGRSCRVSVATLTRRLKVSRSTIQRGLLRLADMGLIQATRGYKGAGMQTENTYQLLSLTPLEPSVPCDTPPQLEGITHDTPPQLEGITHDTPGGITHDTPPLSPMTPQEQDKNVQDKNSDDDDECVGSWKEEKELANTLLNEGLRITDDGRPRRLQPRDRSATLRICRLAVDGKIPIDLLIEQAAIVKATRPKKVGPYFRACVVKAAAARLGRDIVPLLDAIRVPKELTDR